ncbi:MAG: pantoate--beta-alanine ligase [Actinomycetota bacterium]
MKSVTSPMELRTILERYRHDQPTVGLVPTMGALHDGHLSLIAKAKEIADIAVVSIFVNPTQFGAGEDFQAYPRDTQRDSQLAAGANTDVLFIPTAQEVYPSGFATTISVAGLTEPLEGQQRGAAHFNGVTTVVAKLLNMTSPDVLLMGQKDAQQAIVVGRMIKDLDLTVRLEVCPTVREPDGLALSSRNTYLTSDERSQAVALYKALQAGQSAVSGGEIDGVKVLTTALTAMEPFGVVPEYLSLVCPQTLKAVSVIDQPTLLAVAAVVGSTRLIDNVTLIPRS